MSDRVWMSDLGAVQIGFWADIDDGLPKKHDAQKIRATKFANRRGEVLAREKFPSQYFYCFQQKFKRRLPHFFVSGFFFLSAKAAGVFNSYDMGNGACYPVELFQHDRTTLVDASFFTLNIGNTKDAVDVELSENILKSEGVEGTFYSRSIACVDDSIVVKKQCLEGPDIWVDPKFSGTFFVSDKLMKAMRKAGMGKALRPIRCVVN